MEKRIWKGKLYPGKLDDYIKIHDNIWPEMLASLEAQGISNYTIWNCGDEIIGYYECESLAEAERIKAESEVCQRWSNAMQDIMMMEIDQITGEKKVFKQVFKFR